MRLHHCDRNNDCRIRSNRKTFRNAVCAGNNQFPKALYLRGIHASHRDGDVRHVDAIESNQALRVSVHVGNLFAAYASSVGKVLFAELSAEAVRCDRFIPATHSNLSQAKRSRGTWLSKMNSRKFVLEAMQKTSRRASQAYGQ